VRCLPALASQPRPAATPGVPEVGRPVLSPALSPVLSEVFAATPGDGAVTGFVLSSLPRTTAPILWVQDHLSQAEAGRPYLPGLGAGRQLLHLALARAADVLGAMEEGLCCTALAAVVGEVWGAPPVLDFTATRRLAIRAEAGNLPCWLIRRGARPDLSAARNRWRVAALPSRAHPHDPMAPGDPRWQVELFRARAMPPGTWVASHDRAADRVDFSAASRDGALAESLRAAGGSAAG